MKIITRFAPSPTGYLHIGSARCALFNYLFTRHHQLQGHQAKFLLRIEDTDRARSTKEAIDAIFSSLKWLGLDWDDEVIYQSQRNELYKQAVLQLVEQGGAYYCFASQEEIEGQRTKALDKKEAFIFHSPWRDAKKEDYPVDIKPVVRLKAPRVGITVIQDRLQGDVVIENIHLDDMVLLRSDGTATYMLAVVVDDHDMQVTHIIRGDDHLTNAARQILLYKAFGWQVPEMVHIPLIYGPDGAKLSKRHGALGVEAYREMGYLPQALCNYLLRLGWGHGDAEIISRDQAIKWFDLGGLGKSPARLDFAKMKNLNAHYLRDLSDEELTNIALSLLEQQGYTVNRESKNYIIQGMSGMKVRAELTLELADIARIYLVDSDVQYSTEAQDVIDSCDKNLIQEVIQSLQELTVFDKDTVQSALKTIADRYNLKIGELMMPLRALVTGLTASPSVFEIMAIIGRQHSINRLKKLLK